MVEPLDDPEDDRTFAAVFAVVRANRTSRSTVFEPWLVRGVLRRDETGRPALTRLAVEHLDDDAAEVTGHVLRFANVDGIRTNALIAWSRRREARQVLIDAGWNITGWSDAKARSTRGRPSRPPGHIQEVAERAVALATTGETRIRARLASHYDVSVSTVDGWLRTARADGWLPPVSRGNSDFTPGPRLLAEGGKDG